MIADVRPSKIASTLSFGVMGVVLSLFPLSEAFGGVVKANRRVSLLPYMTKAFSLDARTALVTLRYKGSFGVKKLTMTVKRLTRLVLGVNGTASSWAYVKRVSRA